MTTNKRVNANASKLRMPRMVFNSIREIHTFAAFALKTPVSILSILICITLFAACNSLTPATPTANTLPPPSATPVIHPSPIPPTLVSPFLRMTNVQGFPEQSSISDLWISPQGDLWVATNTGLYAKDAGQNDNFSHIYNEPLKQIIGLQEDPYTIWALGADGNTIHAFRGNRQWIVYGSNEGWDPLPNGVYNDTPAVTADGTVWLATGRDELRRFNPASGTWSTLRASDLGFAPADPNYQGHYLTDAVVSPTGSLWVSDCIGMGDDFTGQGVRYYRDGVWESIPVTENQCVFEIERDVEGRMWVGGTSAILVYDSVTGSWTDIPVPPWERRQYILHIAFAPSGHLWIGTLLCGGASCDTSAFFIRQDDQWLPLLDVTTYSWAAPYVSFDSYQTAWACWEGVVYRQTTNGITEIGALQTDLCMAIVDGSGTVWVVAFDGNDVGLWEVDIP